MTPQLEEKLSGMHAALSTAAEVLLKMCQDLSHKYAVLNVSGMEEDIRLTLLAAKDFQRRLVELFHPSHEHYADDLEDLPALGRKLRHDLRNGVGAIKGYAEMVVEDCRDEGVTAFDRNLTAILTQAKNIEHLISEKVQFSYSGSPDSGKSSASSSPAMMGELPSTSLDYVTLDEGVGALTGRVLVVDDERPNRDQLTAMLNRDGHTVSQASDGIEALTAMSEGDFDVVLLDLNMPGLNGFEVMSRMRSNKKLRNIRIIVISGMEQDENAIKCIAFGAEDYLSKPVNPLLLRARIGACMARHRWRDQERLYRMHLEAEKSKSEGLLLNTLPASVVQRLSSGERVIADAFDNVTVLFSDFVGFTKFASARRPNEVVEVLNRVFVEFDQIAFDLGVEKIKTIGDGYMAVAGLPIARPDHAVVIAEMALSMIDSLELMNRRLGTELEIRIGVNTGPVIAGVIGTHKFAYDVWGHTVNAASRLESYSKPQGIHVSSETAKLLESAFILNSRGISEVRGIGTIETFYLDGRKEITIRAREAANVAAAAAAAEVQENQFSVLIADDDEHLRDIICRRFQRLGWRVAAAPDGEAALKELRKNKYSLLVTDCEMPKLDGLELTEAVRKDEEKSGDHMAIIGITGNDSIEYALRCMHAGVDAFLPKPVMWVELEKCAVRLVAEKGTSNVVPMSTMLNRA